MIRIVLKSQQAETPSWRSTRRSAGTTAGSTSSATRYTAGATATGAEGGPDPDLDEAVERTHPALVRALTPSRGGEQTSTRLAWHDA
jgi:hypothetical protein